MTTMKILVTGGAGYIGCHMLVVLLEAGFDVLVLDNLSNSTIASIESVRSITGKNFEFSEGDIRNKALLAEIFAKHEIQAVMHFAGLKSVVDSLSCPLAYYDNNVVGTITLLEAMNKSNVRRFVFSSSANVYGEPRFLPIGEEVSIAPTNPYGASKAHIERILEDLANSDRAWKIASLRYFNPIGAHKSGRIGESPIGVPSNVMPYIVQVAAGHRSHLNIFGNDYETADGTGVRDFIHVMDLVEGHLAALNALDKLPSFVCNLGTGVGHSVLELVQTFSVVNNVSVPYIFAPRRDGDVAVSFADPGLAYRLLEWKAKRDLREMCEDHWRWQLNS